MKIRYMAAGCTAALILAGLLSTQVAQAEDQVARRPVVTDVALHDGGILYGKLVNHQGLATVQADVTLTQEGREVAASQTSRDGQFRFTGLKAGVYQLQTPGGRGHYRLWAPHTAPPTAHAALVIVEELVVRGQDPQQHPDQKGHGHQDSHRLKKALIVSGVGLGIAGGIVAIDYNPSGS